MLAKILQKTKGKPCSCPTGKQCSSCKLKRVIRPHVTIEEPRRLPAPVSITYYNPPKPVYQNNTTIQYVDKPKKKILKKKKYGSSPPRCINFCRWYKRRKALKELIKEKKEEDKRERKRKREEFERERMKELIEWEQARQKTQPIQPTYTLPPPKTKTIYFKEKSTQPKPKPKPKPQPEPKPIPKLKPKPIPKPRVYSKYVTVKKIDRKNSISNRFVNYCYRLCCQLYCYLTCIILVIITVLYIV